MESRKTRQKAVLDTELRNISHLFSAEGLHERVTGRGIGIATVYRFLRERASSGNLHSYSCERRVLYSLSERCHYHFTCKSCGQVSHKKINKIGFLEKELKLGICHLQIDITGICTGCARKAGRGKNR